MYFIFISPSVPRFSVKKSVNQLIKNKRPYILSVITNNIDMRFMNISQSPYTLTTTTTTIKYML